MAQRTDTTAGGSVSLTAITVGRRRDWEEVEVDTGRGPIARSAPAVNIRGSIVALGLFVAGGLRPGVSVGRGGGEYLPVQGWIIRGTWVWWGMGAVYHSCLVSFT